MDLENINIKMEIISRVITLKIKKEEKESIIFMKGEFYNHNLILGLLKFLKFN
jgi:hypothetical protein